MCVVLTAWAHTHRKRLMSEGASPPNNPLYSQENNRGNLNESKAKFHSQTLFFRARSICDSLSRIHTCQNVAASQVHHQWSIVSHSPVCRVYSSNFWPGTLPECSKLSHFLHYRLPTVESFVDYFGITSLGRERGLSSFVFEGETNP